MMPDTNRSILQLVSGNGLVPSLLRFYLFYLKNLALELFNWPEVVKENDKERVKEKEFGLTLKRLLVLLLLLLACPPLIVWNHVGFALDDLLYPGWRTTPVETPLFIVGNARSGTTWLHRLLAQDRSTFTSFTTWELLVAPSVTWRVLFRVLYAVDQRFLGCRVDRLRKWCEHRFVGDVGIHPVGLEKHEEDEWVMAHIWSCQLVLFFFPAATSLLNDLVLFDDNNSTSGTSEELSTATKDRIFRYYRECVQRHLYFHHNYRIHSAHSNQPSNKLIFLSKNPTFTLRLRSLYAAFPDCRVLAIIRDPVQSVPSMVSYIAHVWRTFASPLLPYPNAQQLIGFCRRHYLFPKEFMAGSPSGVRVHQLVWISYEGLQMSLESTVMEALAKLRIPALEKQPTNIEETAPVGVDASENSALDQTSPAEQSMLNAFAEITDINDEDDCSSENDLALEIPLMPVGRLSSDLAGSPELFDYDDINRFCDGTSPFANGSGPVSMGRLPKNNNSNVNEPTEEVDRYAELVSVQESAHRIHGVTDGYFHYEDVYGSGSVSREGGSGFAFTAADALRSPSCPDSIEQPLSPVVAIDDIYSGLVSPPAAYNCHPNQSGGKGTSVINTAVNFRDFASLRPRLAVEQQQSATFVSSHRHSVSECCKMSEAELRKTMADVYAIFS